MASALAAAGICLLSRSAAMLRVMSKRLTYHHGDLRRVLLRSSVELLDERGLSALSLREVARRAGVTHSAPYHYFADRSALVAAVAEEGFKVLTSALENARGPLPNPADQFKAIGCAYVRFALENPSYFRVMFRPELTALKGCDDPKHVSQQAFAILVETISECQSKGLAPAGNPMSLVIITWSLLHGLASLWLDGPLSCSPLAESMNAQQLAAVVTETISELFRRCASSPLPTELTLPSFGRTGIPNLEPL